MIQQSLNYLLEYAVSHQLLNEEDFDYSLNRLLELLQVEYVLKDSETIQHFHEEPSKMLEEISNYAVQNGIIAIDTILNRDIFEAKIMDCLIGRPSAINAVFKRLYNVNPKKATDYFYDFSKRSNYVKTVRTNKNITWKSKTEYGTLEMNINISKPEKDPRDIIAASKIKSTDYPKCLLCKENVGYAGRPGRTSHRIIPVTLNKEDFYLQYSPYVYYNEHSIVFMKNHIPMLVNENTFKRLFDFVDLFPHYFLGSNAGLPIVGGSILSHEHYQGGAHHFGIEDAEVLSTNSVNGVRIKKLKWPISVIRLESKEKSKLVEAATEFYNFWISYDDKDMEIYSYTDAPHNAITPIARKHDGMYVLDIALRNNRTSDKYPDGIFHTHQEHHHIKKENIGLIEVMGLIVLPGRLNKELAMIKDAIRNKTNLSNELKIHNEWLTYLLNKYNGEDIDKFIEQEIAYKFVKTLENASVFKQDENAQNHFDKFIGGYIDVLNR